jgi:hypothetical protein
MLGFLPLAQLPVIRLLGGDQFRKFCIICIVILVTTVVLTCVCHEEEERPATPQRTQGFALSLSAGIEILTIVSGGQKMSMTTFVQPSSICPDLSDVFATCNCLHSWVGVYVDFISCIVLNIAHLGFHSFSIRECSATML